jgi:hypothetical protein
MSLERRGRQHPVAHRARKEERVPCAGRTVQTLTPAGAVPRAPERSGFYRNERSVTCIGSDQSGALPIRALKAEAAQRAFELRYTFSNAVEVLTGEREEPHRRARHDGGRPLSRQYECDLAKRVSGAETLDRVATVTQGIGLSLFDEVDGGSVVVERDDLGTRFDLDLAHRGRNLVEFRDREIGEGRKCCDPICFHDPDRARRPLSPE